MTQDLRTMKDTDFVAYAREVAIGAFSSPEGVDVRYARRNLVGPKVLTLHKDYLQIEICRDDEVGGRIPGAIAIHLVDIDDGVDRRRTPYNVMPLAALHDMDGFRRAIAMARDYVRLGTDEPYRQVSVEGNSAKPDEVIVRVERPSRWQVVEKDGKPTIRMEGTPLANIRVEFSGAVDRATRNAVVDGLKRVAIVPNGPGGEVFSKAVGGHSLSFAGFSPDADISVRMTTYGDTSGATKAIAMKLAEITAPNRCLRTVEAPSIGMR